MILGVDPKVDYAFKRLFGVDRNRDILISLLNAVLDPQPGHIVTDVEILTPFNPKETEGDKLSIVDIKACDQEGRLFTIEMQVAPDPYLTKRLLYYWSRLYQQQIHEGDKYHVLLPAVVICFLETKLFPDIASHHLCFRLIDQQHGVAFSDDIAVHLLELKKFETTVAYLQNPLDRWLFFLRHAADLDPQQLPARLDTPEIHHAVKELQMLTQDDIERERYEARLKSRLYENTMRYEMQRLQEVHDRDKQDLERARQELERAQQESQRVQQESQRVQQESQHVQQENQRALQETMATMRALGEKMAIVGQIHFAERLLKRPPTAEERLLQLDMPELQKLAEELASEIDSRRN